MTKVQLELFRTKEQEERLAYKLESHKKQQLQREKDFNTIQGEFDRAGMIEDLHYKIEGKPVWSSEPREFDISSYQTCLLYTSQSPRDRQKSRMPSSA